jgi:predicted MFS family arabinose efflux permease
LGYGPFRRAFAARIVSAAGSWMQSVAAGWLMFELTRSAVAVGVLTLLARGCGQTATEIARGLRPALKVARRGTAHFRILVALVLFALLVGPVQELAPAIARHHGTGARILGYLLAALAAGGLVGNFLIGRPDLQRARRRVLSGVEGLVFAATLVLLAVSGGLGLAMLAMFMTGVAWEAMFVQKLTWISTMPRLE